MLYLGITLIILFIISKWIHQKSSIITVVAEQSNGKVKTRIINRFVIYKSLQDQNGKYRIAFLENRYIVQMKSLKEEWIDVSWATAQ